MRIRIACMILLLLTAIMNITAGKAEKHSAVAYTVESVPNVYVKDMRQHVSDPSGLLMPATCDSINRLFTSLEKNTGIQAMVVMLPSIGDEDVFEFSQRLFRHWGIGEKKRNNGLLITYVADQRTIRFHTGYGLEGILTDAKSKRIQINYMVPEFKKGNVDSGMLHGAIAVNKVLERSMDANSQGEENDSIWPPLLILGSIISAISGVMWYNDRKSRTCRICKKTGGLSLTSRTYYHDIRKRKHKKEIYTCTNCGNVEERDSIIDDNNHNNILRNGTIIGGMHSGRGRGFGGGFGGGSFGGGSSGGGGASSSW